LEFNEPIIGVVEGETERKANYWLVKLGGEVKVYEVGEGGRVRVEIPEWILKINLGLVMDGRGKLGSIFTNMTKEELVSFLSGKGLVLIGFEEGAWEKSGSDEGTWVRARRQGGIRYFLPLVEKESYIITDWRGVPRVVYDEEGEEVWRAEYGPFGEPLYERGVRNYIPFVLYGMYRDEETGLYYNVRRYYDWRIGRYLQPDPVSDLNLYVYVENSPYNFVDPMGMFKTRMEVFQVFGIDVRFIIDIFGSSHVGPPIHEEITEIAIKELGYGKLIEYGSRKDSWEGGVIAELKKGDIFTQAAGIVVKLRCRGYANTVAQGVNRADCIYTLVSSYHCDNSNFGDCHDLVKVAASPETFGLIECKCQRIAYGGGGVDFRKWEKGSMRGLGGGGDDKGRGCSVGNQSIGIRSLPPAQICKCNFAVGASYERLGQLLHPIQDFWAHSDAIYVPGCREKKCLLRATTPCTGSMFCSIQSQNPLPPEIARHITLYEEQLYKNLPPELRDAFQNAKSSNSPSFCFQDCRFLGSLGSCVQVCCEKFCEEGCVYEICTGYGRDRQKWTNNYLPDQDKAGAARLKSGLFNGSGWSAVEDFICYGPPCNAHCMLNKDIWGVDRRYFGVCDKTWRGFGVNIQRDAYEEARGAAIASTKHYLSLFCRLKDPSVCY